MKSRNTLSMQRAQKRKKRNRALRKAQLRQEAKSLRTTVIALKKRKFLETEELRKHPPVH